MDPLRPGVDRPWVRPHRPRAESNAPKRLVVPPPTQFETFGQSRETGGLEAEVGYPARAMRRLTLSMAIAAALALGACGGDDNKSDNASTTTDSTTQTTGTTTGKTTGDGGKKGEDSGKSGKSGSGSGSGGSGSGSGSGSGGSNGGSNGTTTGDDTPTSTQPTPTTPTNVQPTPFKTAKKVCGDFLPEPIKRQIKNGKISKETVAKNYSRGFPEGQRGKAQSGCLAGLNTL